jgi:hypothetical protein
LSILRSCEMIRALEVNSKLCNSRLGALEISQRALTCYRGREKKNNPFVSQPYHRLLITNTPVALPPQPHSHFYNPLLNFHTASKSSHNHNGASPAQFSPNSPLLPFAVPTPILTKPRPSATSNPSPPSSTASSCSA